MSRNYIVLPYMLAFVLVLFNGAGAIGGDHGHGHHEHGKAHKSQVKADKAKHVGDVYPLPTDPLGDSLSDVKKPLIMVHHGQELRFASEANLKKFKADPEQYLAKVNAQIVARQAPLYPLETCVVSGGKLGGMGKPYDFVYGNRLVRFCCGGCVGKFKKNAEKLLAKIDAAVVARQMKDYPLKTCIVSDEKWGGEMGPAIDKVFNTRLVRFCCKGCMRDFKKHPAKFFKKLQQAKKDKK